LFFPGIFISSRTGTQSLFRNIFSAGLNESISRRPISKKIKKPLKFFFAGQGLIFLLRIIFNVRYFEFFFHVLESLQEGPYYFAAAAATAAVFRTTLCGALCKVLKQPVQMSIRLPSTVAYCKFGYFRVQFVGL